MADRQGVEIDYCPSCRGVWLDRGELDKIIDRASSSESGQGAGVGLPTDRARGPGVAPPAMPMPPQPPPQYQQPPSYQQAPGYQQPGGYPPPRKPDDSWHGQPSPYGQPGQPYKKRKSLLGELFDF